MNTFLCDKCNRHRGNFYRQWVDGKKTNLCVKCYSEKPFTPSQLHLLKKDLDSIVYADLTDAGFRAVEKAKKRVDELIGEER